MTRGRYAHWYFFRQDDRYSTRFPLVQSLYRTLRYHLGSLAFGAFLIAIVQLARIFAEYLDRQTKQFQEGNKMLMLAMKCVKLVLFCLEKTVKFITGYCYIYIALQGSSFCFACFSVFTLIITNAAQLAVNTLVRTILTYMQLIAVPLACYQVRHLPRSPPSFDGISAPLPPSTSFSSCWHLRTPPSFYELLSRLRASHHCPHSRAIRCVQSPSRRARHPSPCTPPLSSLSSPLSSLTASPSSSGAWHVA